ncbi:MAG: glycosyltransferase family 4 protein [Caldilineaceae bacterium]|nr:glycosyltransferase family 4 protein [Caldilineaceae bacterium]
MSTYFVDARTATPHFPGIGRYVTNLVTALAGQIAPDEALQILVPPPAAQLRSQDRPWSETLPQQARLHLLTAAASNFSLSQQWSIPRLIRQARTAGQTPALYHSPYYLIPYRTGLPTVVTLHDLIALILPDAVSLRARWLFRLTAYAALRASTQIIIGTESARQELLAHFPIAPERLTTVPHAAAPRFQPQPEAVIQAARAHYQLPGDFIFYCGINKPHKNLVRLIDAYAALDATAPPLIIGGVWDERYPEPKQQVARHGLEDRVRFLGPVSDQHLPALYSAATLFIFPSLYEGFGLPVIEAMACGAPVACSDATGLRDVAGDAALLFDPQDTGSIVTALRTALENPGLRAELHTRSLAQAGRFSWSSTAQQTLAIYRQVLQRKTPH